ncbi:hypothetical protein [Cupriavidus sp. IDO]|uniref:hypothetical protein n=1 Tax=Cupriavidus sp. IDO TaxID=1539142 RepID=UPI000579629D|nr:hypothetical protein [Cupriavidus sp. IDO]KWR84481.1 hypothetical protein RM96_27985 [Cupriavidus sp. IDO]
MNRNKFREFSDRKSREERGQQSAAADEPSSATFSIIASHSKSGSFDIDNPATMVFIHFNFEK